MQRQMQIGARHEAHEVPGSEGQEDRRLGAGSRARETHLVSAAIEQEGNAAAGIRRHFFPRGLAGAKIVVQHPIELARAIQGRRGDAQSAGGGRTVRGPLARTHAEAGLADALEVDDGGARSTAIHAVAPDGEGTIGAGMAPFLGNVIERRILEGAGMEIEGFGDGAGPVAVVLVLAKLEIDAGRSCVGLARFFVVLADVVAAGANEADAGLAVVAGRNPWDARAHGSLCRRRKTQDRD